MPSTRRNVCARRSRPARAPGFFGQPALVFRDIIPARSVAARRRSEAVPVQLPRSAMSLRTQTATGSASMTLFDRGPAVRLIGARECASGPERCFARRGPQGEVGHPRQARETNVRQVSASRARPRRAGRPGCAVARSRTRAKVRSRSAVAAHQLAPTSEKCRGRPDPAG